jgi:signal peptide peptidase SppA
MSPNAIALAVANRMNMREALIEPNAVNANLVLSHLMSADVELEEAAARTSRDNKLLARYGYSVDDTIERKPFAYADGVAVIPVQGMLLNRCDWCWPGYLTGYNFLRAQMQAATQDPDVETIVLDCDSGGGECAGCFELCDDMYAMRDLKKIVAVVDSNCYSACYAVASTAHKIIVTPSGGAGSIGVVATHVDMSGMLDKFGVKVTFIFAGDHKVDGNPYEKLPDDVRAQIQANVNLSYDAFVAQVARNRGLSDKAVRDTKAQCFRAEDALKLGLVDAIQPPSKALGTFIDELMNDSDDETPVNPDQPEQEQAMSQTQTTPGGNQAANEQAITEAANAARVAERARVSGIMGHAEAAGRTELANHLAMNTNMSVEEAAGVMAASPKTQAAEKKPEVTSKPGESAFHQAMNTTQHPNVGANGEGVEQEANSDEAAASRILASHSAATGVQYKKSA